MGSRKSLILRGLGGVPPHVPETQRLTKLFDKAPSFCIMDGMFTKHYRLIGLVLLLFALMFLLYARASGAPSESLFLKAINQVETSGRTGPILGDNGKALGPFQIHEQYWRDSGVQGSYGQCANYDYAAEVVRCYLRRYAQRAYLTSDWETCARVHNGGPRGYAHDKTKKYWGRVKRVLTRYQA